MLTTLLTRTILGMPPDGARISIDDIEARFRALQGDATSAVAKARPAALAGGVGGGVVLLAIFYLVGRRKGRRRATVLEIRRVV